MNTLIFDSIFKSEIQDLINLKRAQGFKYVTEEFALKRIDKYLAGKNIQEKVINKSVVDEWCLRKAYETQANQKSRISMYSSSNIKSKTHSFNLSRSVFK
jgi:integrase/recombinase XerD